MYRLDDGRYIIGFDDGYQLGKTANYVFDNGVHMIGSMEPTLSEKSLFYDGEYFKVGEGRTAITEDKVSDDDARLRTMAAIAMELRGAGIHKAEVVLAVGLPFSNYGRDKMKLIDWSVFATISRPLVSLSMRWTIPGRITPLMLESSSRQ